MSAKPAVRTSIRAIAIGSLAGALSACVSAPPPPQDQMSRTQVETAPADLQLLCADAAAKASGADSTKILPVSSSRIDSKTYQVELDASGKKTSCLVDTDGNVKSVQPT
ncbi:MAG: hypothetical protein EOR46_15045 [Mesorhizobium sp.]|nr:hypothetical protein [Mesorhizobium sp.]RWK41832.1 MAG: hypothetical protein EOR46_15045 [Mesorhizobium sp.]RWK61394.1 MAG: hypothetical protein EOR54_33320 [Mesorhizobium sp.]RWK70521.1 MAG: hypothetical protein EOR50_33920 [Mesorhizobium sp.]RWK83355.1 MAG: hypothetical protein EOR51_06820 [Mesorhizobium sp.]RWK99180.1 MAG: hypothetical protein EOR55_33365 [Mesorhizobium sp.]